jgi:hypothetical protein
MVQPAHGEPESRASILVEYAPPSKTQNKVQCHLAFTTALHLSEWLEGKNLFD